MWATSKPRSWANDDTRHAFTLRIRARLLTRDAGARRHHAARTSPLALSKGEQAMTKNTLGWLERRVALVWFTVLILAAGPLVSFAADVLTPMAVKTKTNGDVVAKIVDSAGSNVAAVDASGRVKVDASGVAVPITDNGASVTVDNAGTFPVQDSEKLADNAGFTDGTSKVGMCGFVFDEAAGTALTENDAAAARVDSKRAQVFVIED